MPLLTRISQVRIIDNIDAELKRIKDLAEELKTMASDHRYLVTTALQGLHSDCTALSHDPGVKETIERRHLFQLARLWIGRAQQAVESANLRGRLRYRDTESGTLKSTIREYENILKARDSSIESNQKAIANQEKTIASQLQTITNQDIIIAVLKERQLIGEARLVELNAALEAHKTTITSLQASIAEKDFIIWQM